MKILCSTAKIGGVIGKGGSNVRQIQQETGTDIHVDDVAADSDERVICVSSFEVSGFCKETILALVVYGSF